MSKALSSGRRLLKEADNVVCRDWPGIEISLNRQVSECFETSLFGYRLHAFNNAIKAHIPTEREQRLDDLIARGILVQTRYKTAIDLDLGERERMEVRQARKACTKVVQGNAASQRSQSFRGTTNLRKITDKGGFSYFEIDPGGIESAPLDLPDDVVDAPGKLRSWADRLNERRM